jgi:hypothetical protein
MANVLIDHAELFNRKLNDFIEDLEAIGMHNRVTEYPMLKASCAFLAQMDKQRPAHYFHTYVLVPYEEQIKKRDEQFFLSQPLGCERDMAIVNVIRQIWRTLDETNKNAIWQHLQVLTVLSRRVLAA